MQSSRRVYNGRIEVLNSSGDGTWWSLFSPALRQPAFWVTCALLANILEGAVRKWVPGFAGGGGRVVAYFSKDLLLVWLAILLASRPAVRGTVWSVFQSWNSVACVFVLLGAMGAATSGVNLVGAVLTLRALVVLPLLVSWVGPRLHSFPLQAFANCVIVLCVSNGLLGLLQSGLPAGHFLNRYAAEEAENIVEVASGVRATGTFAYLAGLSMMATAGAWSGMVGLSLGRSAKDNFLGVAGILGAFACAFASGSRGPVVVVGVMLLVWGVSSTQAWWLILKIGATGAVIAVIAAVAIPSVSERFLTMGEGVVDRFQNTDSNTGRMFGQWASLAHASADYPFGGSLGGSQVAGQYAVTGKAGFADYESQFPRIVVETGVLGFLGYLLLVGGMVVSLQQVKRQTSDKGFVLAMTASQMLILGLAYGSMVYNHTGASFIFLIFLASMSAVSYGRAQEVNLRGRTSLAGQ